MSYDQQLADALREIERLKEHKAGWEVEGFIDRLTRRDDTNSERLVLEAISHLRAFSRDCDALREDNAKLRAEIERLQEEACAGQALGAKMTAIGIGFSRNDGETWLECALRYARHWGVEKEVQRTYSEEVDRGATEQEAAWAACYEWDALNMFEDGQERKPKPWPTRAIVRRINGLGGKRKD